MFCLCVLCENVWIYYSVLYLLFSYIYGKIAKKGLGCCKGISKYILKYILIDNFFLDRIRRCCATKILGVFFVFLPKVKNISSNGASLYHVAVKDCWQARVIWQARHHMASGFTRSSLRSSQLRIVGKLESYGRHDVIWQVGLRQLHIFLIFCFILKTLIMHIFRVHQVSFVHNENIKDFLYFKIFCYENFWLPYHTYIYNT